MEVCFAPRSGRFILRLTVFENTFDFMNKEFDRLTVLTLKSNVYYVGDHGIHRNRGRVLFARKALKAPKMRMGSWIETLRPFNVLRCCW